MVMVELMSLLIKQGFYNAVNNQKVIPQQYIRQHKEVHETIYVFVRIEYK